jgi:hypothetical protein
MILSTYDQIRDKIRQGDLIGFGGTGFVSGGIELFTRSPLSHIGIVLDTQVSIGGQPQQGHVIMLIESTSLNGKSGVQINRLSERVSNYPGKVWWLPLADAIRAKCDWQKFYDYALSLDGHPYAYIPVAMMVFEPIAHWPIIGRLVQNPRDTSQLFCSALDAALIEKAGGLDFNINFDEVSPQDLAAMPLYSGATQIKGPATDIPHFNGAK